MATDLVCGMKVDPQTASSRSHYRGETYYFCSPVCKGLFDRQPEKYLAATAPGEAGTSASEPAPVTACGGKIEDPEKYPSAIFRGERVYFCTAACLAAFQSDPERFMAGEIEHPV